MRVQVVGHDVEMFRRKVEESGFELVEEGPEVIIAYGGDGAFIGAEQLYPGVPKLGIRRDRTCVKCPHHHDEVVLRNLREGTLEPVELIKLHGTWNGAHIRAVNDIFLRNTDPRAAVRFVVSLNGRPVTEEMIGDGLVMCTPFGSSAYFRSITRTMIRTGIGVAFNNCTDLLNHLVIAEDEEITVELTRGPATLAADNDERCFHLDAGDRLDVRRAREKARVLAIDTLRCADCRYVRAPRRRY